MGVPAGGHCEALDRQTSVSAAMSSLNFNRVLLAFPL
jgi:hypothetical protein